MEGDVMEQTYDVGGKIVRLNGQNHTMDQIRSAYHDQYPEIAPGSATEGGKSELQDRPMSELLPSNAQRREYDRTQNQTLSERGLGLPKLHDAFRNLGAGTMESLQNVINKFPDAQGMLNKNLPEKYRSPNSKNADWQEIFGINDKNKRPIVQAIPEMAASMGVPGVGLEGLIAKSPGIANTLMRGTLKAGGEMLSQGGTAAALSKENGGEHALKAATGMGPMSIISQMAMSNSPQARLAARVMNAMIGGTIGGYAGYKMSPSEHPAAKLASSGTGAVLGAATMGKKNIKDYATKAENAIAKSPEYSVVSQAGKDAKVSSTIGQRTNDERLINQEKKAKIATSKNADRAIEAEKKSLQEQKSAIEDLNTQIYDAEKYDKIKDELYDVSGKVKIPEKIMELASHSELLNKAERLALKDTNFMDKMKRLDPNSIAYADLIKQKLDSMINTRVKSGASTSNMEAARSKLLKSLDKISPEYKLARSLAERKFARQEIEAALNSKDFTAHNMYDLLRDKKYSQDLAKHLRDSPEALKKLEDIKIIFERLPKVNIKSIARNAPEPGMERILDNPKSGLAVLAGALKDGKYNEQVLDLMTNPNSDEIIKKLLKTTEHQKFISEFTKALGRPLSQKIAKEEKK